MGGQLGRRGDCWKVLLEQYCHFFGLLVRTLGRGASGEGVSMHASSNLEFPVPLPFIAIAALAAVAGTGAVVGTCGALDLSEARSRVKKARKSHAKRLSRTESHRDRFMSAAHAYGRNQLDAAETSVGRFLDVLRREGEHGAVFGVHQLDGIDISTTELAELQALRVQSLELERHMTKGRRGEEDRPQGDLDAMVTVFVYCEGEGGDA